MVSMADEFKINWKKAIEDAAIDYADAYVELQCDADNDHQREHREALRDLRETIRRGLECAAAPQPAAQPTTRPEPPLLGRWHHGNGVLCSGSLRIATWDCDTNPPDEFRDEVLDWVCSTLNAAITEPAAKPAAKLCEFCGGLGEAEYMTTHLGPDDYSVAGQCMACGGSGVEAPQPAAQPTSDLANAFYEHIKHGDDAHQAWLKEQTLAWFAKHVPQPAAQPLKSRPDFMAGYNAGMDDAKRMARMDVAQPEPCYCDRMQIGDPSVSCGDCPTRDYNQVNPPAQPERKPMLPDAISVGDTVEDSPVGAGIVTDISDAGYPRVNHVAVARLRRTDGVVFDPHRSYEKDAARESKKGGAA